MTTPAYTPQRLAWLTLRRMRGEPITYTVGEFSVEIIAVRTRPVASDVSLEAPLVIESRRWDWLIDPDELVNEGERIEPARGHKITAQDGTEFKPQPSDGFDAVWRWSDGLQTWMRVHTEQQ